MATVQISTPTITLPDDNEGDSRVTVHFQVMARKTPVAEGVPAAIHGELQVTVPIHQDRAIVDDADTISVDLRAEDLGVRFTPDAGAPLSDAEHELVTQLIRNVLIQRLPTGDGAGEPSGGAEGFSIRHWRLKALRENGNTAVALLLNLRDVEMTNNDVAGVRRRVP